MIGPRWFCCVPGGRTSVVVVIVVVVVMAMVSVCAPTTFGVVWCRCSNEQRSGVIASRPAPPEENSLLFKHRRVFRVVCERGPPTNRIDFEQYF